MTTLEIILVIMIALIVYGAHLIIKHFKDSYKVFKDANYRNMKDLSVLAEEGKLNKMLSVEEFNIWFNSPKDPDIYAHPGIFLRTDKLGVGHIEDYLEFASKGLVMVDDFKYLDIIEFEDRIRKDWFKKQREL